MDNLRSIFVESIVLYDDYENFYDVRNFSFAPTSGCITLDVSGDDKVHFTDMNNEIIIVNSVLKLANYQGKILIPPNTGLQITNTSKNLAGVIAAPAYIQTSGDIDLTVLKESELELCLTGDCEVKINNILSKYKNSERMKEPVLTRSYRSFEDRHIRHLRNRQKNITTCEMIEVCLHYNLLHIDKDTGEISLRYTPPKFDTEVDARLRDKHSLYKYTHREMLIASNAGKYLKAQYLQNILKQMKTDIIISQNRINYSSNTAQNPDLKKSGNTLD